MHLRIQMFQASAEVKGLNKFNYSICNTVRTAPFTLTTIGLEFCQCQYYNFSNKVLQTTTYESSSSGSF